jgi:hypothetical protein
MPGVNVVNMEDPPLWRVWAEVESQAPYAHVYDGEHIRLPLLHSPTDAPRSTTKDSIRWTRTTMSLRRGRWRAWRLGREECCLRAGFDLSRTGCRFRGTRVTVSIGTTSGCGTICTTESESVLVYAGTLESDSLAGDSRTPLSSFDSKREEWKSGERAMKPAEMGQQERRVTQRQTRQVYALFLPRPRALLINIVPHRIDSNRHPIARRPNPQRALDSPFPTLDRPQRKVGVDIPILLPRLGRPGSDLPSMFGGR